MKFLTDLLALIASRRDPWLRPIVILLLVLGVLLLAGRFVDVLMPRSEPDQLPPLSRDHYRHDGAFFSR
jgi:Family of unknown function (DUF5989)